MGDTATKKKKSKKNKLAKEQLRAQRASTPKPIVQAQPLIKPMGERVLVQRDKAETVSKGGIVLVDAAQQKPTRGRVLEVGPGKQLDNGTRGELQVKKGDHVLFSPFAPEIVDLGETEGELLLLHERDILAILEDPS